MTTYITNRKGNKMQLNGDILSGDTYPVKEYIKKYLDGKWVADQKAWRVDVAKVNRWLNMPGAEIRIDTAPVVSTNGQSDAILPQNISYAEFSRRMNRADSDL